MSAFNLSAVAVRERSVTLFLLVAISIAGVVAFLTLGLEGTSRLDAAHARASEIEERIRRERPDVADVIVHTEP